MSGDRALSLLGLALRGGRLAVGEEPAALAARAGQARLLLLASDAAGNTLRRAEHLAREAHCLWLILPFTKAELGGALGRGSAAIAALTDLGLAAAVTERLAERDPERYAETAARMDLKRRRARERQSAPRREGPKKAPPLSPEGRRPSKPRREGGPETKGRPHTPGGGRKPEERGKWQQERRGAGKGRPYSGGRPSRPARSRPRPGGGGPDRGR